MIAIDYQEAVREFAKRFDGLTLDEVRERFDDLWHRGALVFDRGADGALRVRLGSARKP